MKIILFLVFFAVTATVTASPEHEFLSSETIFASASNSDGQLSPDGKYFSYINREDKTNALALVNLDDFTVHLALKLSDKIPLRSHYWLTTDTLVLNLMVNNELSTYLYTIETIEKNDGIILIEGKNKKLEGGYIVDRLENEANFVLFSKFGEDSSELDQSLYRISLKALKTESFDKAELIEEADKGLLIYGYDILSNRLLAVFYDDDDETISVKFKELNVKKWKTVFTFANGEFTFTPIGFIDDTHVAVLTNKTTDKTALQSFDIKTQKLGEVLYQHDKYDLTDATLSRTGEVESVEYVKNGLPKRLRLKAASQDLSMRVDHTFDGDYPRVIDEHTASQRSLVYVTGSNEPGVYYLYDGKLDQLQPLVSSYPQLHDIEFPQHQVISMKATDGTPLEAYLTTPTKYSVNTLIVMPHGGPIGVRDYNLFEPSVQYLANRGFTVLRVNFRGSEGFGKIFQEKGIGELGQLIETDISTLVDHVLATSSFDNVCAMGSSYGAYSSMTLAMNHPDIYQCVVASYGIYDIPLLFNYSNFRSGKAFSERVAKVVGENNIEKKMRSPVYRAAEINVPSLIIAGKKDEVAGFEQSNRMRYVLEKLGKPVESLFYSFAGHGHSDWYGDRHEYAYSIDFLQKSLNMAPPQPAQLSAASRKAIAYDYTVLADVFEFGSLTKENPAKAIEFTRLASKYGASRATFNLAASYQQGDQVEEDFEKALELYEKAAKLGYSPAYYRLASLYLDGVNTARNDEKALEYLLKSIASEDDNLNKSKHKLAYFYCTAGAEYLSVKKCQEEFHAQWKHVENEADVDSFYQHLSQAIVMGNFTVQERALFTKFAIEVIGIEYPEYDFEFSASGIWVYQDSRNYGGTGDYVLIKETQLSAVSERLADESVSVGILFTPDHVGFASSDKYTYAIFKWEELDGDGNLIETIISRLISSAINKWSARYRVRSYEPGTKYKLTVYDVAGEVKYQEVFK